MKLILSRVFVLLVSVFIMFYSDVSSMNFNPPGSSPMGGFPSITVTPPTPPSSFWGTIAGDFMEAFSVLSIGAQSVVGAVGQVVENGLNSLVDDEDEEQAYVSTDDAAVEPIVELSIIDSLNLLMVDHKYSEVITILEQRERDNLLDDEIRAWIFARADHGEFLMLYWAARLCLQSDLSDVMYLGHCYLLKAKLRLLQDHAAFAKCAITDVLEFWSAKIAALQNGIVDPEELIFKATSWVCELDIEGSRNLVNFVSPVWVLEKLFSKHGIDMPSMTPELRAKIAQRRAAIVSQIKL